METIPERRSGTDRRIARRFRFNDRRTGFGRRKLNPFFRTMRDASWALIGLLVLLNVFSLFDAAFTMLELRLGIAQEGNPVLGMILGSSPFLALGFKTALMVLVSLAIWRGRRYRAILAVAPTALALYAAVLSYHLGSLSGLGWL